MKKFALLTLVMAFAFALNAQTISVEKYPAPTNAKEKAIGVMPSLQKEMEELGWITHAGYLNYLLPQSYELKRTFYTIFPDSCMVNVSNQMGEVESFCTWMHAMGASFDPYSESYDRMFSTGIFPTPDTPSVLTHPYRLDSIMIGGVYYLGENTRNASNPDTLRVYISYHKVYERIGNRSEWVALHYISDEYMDTALFSPMVNVDTVMVKQSKGSALTPAATNTIAVDYILGAEDTTYYYDSIINGDTTRYFRYTFWTIPTTLNGVTKEGFEVPAGAVVSVIAKFLPGYDYDLGDTLIYGEVDENNYYKTGFPKYKSNIFRILGYYEDVDTKAFCDPYGYNSNFFEHMYQRYQMWNELYNSMYYPSHQHLPMFYYNVKYDSLVTVPVCDSSKIVKSGISEVENIIESVYPNPANDYVNVNLKYNNDAVIRIYNIMGQAIKTLYTNKINNNIKIGDLSAGMYIINVEQNGQRFSTKLSIR